jgi:outer membrane protein assembly factor BamD (BamD/ComL family)
VPAAPPEIPAPPRSSLHEETTLLREAEIALARGDGATALRRLDELAARQPGGVLREERMAARVLALCAAGRTEEARREGEHFVAAMPASIQVPRVKGSCAFSGR